LKEYENYVSKKSSGKGSAKQKVANFAKYLGFALKKCKKGKYELEAVIDTNVGEKFLAALANECKASAATKLNYIKAIKTCLANTDTQWPELAPKSNKFKESF